MNNYEEWAQLVAKKIKGEADLIAAIEKEELDDAAATEAFVNSVLEPFLPENFGIGSGRVVDAFGNHSENLEVIIYNRDFPRIGLRATQNAYLYESVLAVFAIRAKFIRKTFFDAMNACASLADLEANIDKTVLVRLAKKNGLSLGPNKKFVHRDPLHTERFDLIGRPPAFVFGFGGIKNSYRQLQENVELWIEHRHKEELETEMKALPAVIATQGVFAWRNAAPLALSNREMLGIGNDEAPIRLIILQLLYLLNRRLNVTADGYGLKPNLKAYLSQFAPPKFEVGAGNIAEVVDMNKSANAGSDEKPFTEKTRSSLYVPAEDRAKAVEPETPAPVAEKPAAAAKPAPAAVAPAAMAEKPAAVAPAPVPEKPAQPAPIEKPAAPAAVSGEAQFDKPSPFAAPPSAPASAPESTASADAAVFDKPSPFASKPAPAEETAAEDKADFRAPLASPLGSAPIPMDDATASMPVPEMPADPEPEPEPEPAAPKAAPLGSAPIPPSEPAAAKPAAKVIPPKPPVDIPLDGPAEEPAASGNSEDDFIDTMVIPPDATASRKEPSRNSTDAFIARVKEQLSSSEPPQDNEPQKQDPFTSTIPQ